LRPGRNAKQNILLLTLLSALVLTAGCTSEEARSVALTQAGVGSESPEASSRFDTQVTLCRKLSKKSGRPIGAGEIFQITSKSYVNALVEFSAVEQERTYVVHLVWIKPGGREMFRKYIEVRQAPVPEGRHRAVVTRLDATELHDVKRDTLFSAKPEFSLNTRLNISTAKNRIPGPYLFEVYLDRRLLLRESFVVEGEFPAES